jgi:hypothetical protein
MKKASQNQELINPRRKWGEEDAVPALSLHSYETRVGLDHGLHYMFIVKSNINAECKKMSSRMSSKEYCHGSKFI